MSNDLKGILREKILNAVEEHIKNVGFLDKPPNAIYLLVHYNNTMIRVNIPLDDLR